MSRLWRKPSETNPIPSENNIVFEPPGEARPTAVEPDGLPLDVERLARALEVKQGRENLSLYDLWSTTQHSFESPHEVAQLIAAEYARLAAPSEAEKP